MMKVVGVGSGMKNMRRGHGGDGLWCVSRPCQHDVNMHPGGRPCDNLYVRQAQKPGVNDAWWRDIHVLFHLLEEQGLIPAESSWPDGWEICAV